MMNELLPSLRGASSAARDLVFVEDERHLYGCANRHLAAAKALASGDDALIPDADFMVMMAAECLMKHLYCMVRFTKGFSGPDETTEFGSLKLSSSFVHDVKRIGALVVTSSDDLRQYEPLNLLLNHIPASGDWNNGRYKTKEVSDTWRDNVRKKIELIEQISRDISENSDAD